MQIVEQLCHRVPDAGGIRPTLEYLLLHRLRQIGPKLDHCSTKDLLAIRHRKLCRSEFVSNSTANIAARTRGEPRSSDLRIRSNLATQLPFFALVSSCIGDASFPV